MEEFTTCFQGTGCLSGGGARQADLWRQRSAACEPGRPGVPLEYQPPAVRAALGFGKFPRAGGV